MQSSGLVAAARLAWSFGKLTTWIRYIVHTATPYKIFRLLVPTTSTTPPNAPTVDLEGTRWTVTEYAPLFDGDIPEFTCVSYSCGPGRVANPLAPGEVMSNRVIPVTEAAIRSLNPAAIWVDAFCVPVQEPERTACLLSMGAIYASAAHVVAVLSKPCSSLLDEAVQKNYPDEAGLHLLENDAWVSRAWTYQEIVNSTRFCFTAEGSRVSLDGQQFLSEIMSGIENYKRAHGYDSFMFRSLHPRLDNLEDTIADWRMADYAERSAYQVMSSMDRRTAERPGDCFNAMIGAISADPLGSQYKTTIHPAEYFMQLCEEKEDFSFIFSSAPRSNAPGRSWRPLAGPIPAIQPWHTFGDGQSGTLDPSCLRLHNMCRMNLGSVNATAIQFITKRLWNTCGDSSSGNTPDQILRRLRQAGFAGCGEFIELEDGYFFPLSTNASGDDFIVYISAGLRWAYGGPGLIATPEVTGANQFRDVGVFVGPVPEKGDSITLI